MHLIQHERLQGVFMKIGHKIHKQNSPSLKVENWRNVLTKAVMDPSVNIKIATLGGDDTAMMGITELQPGSKIRAHVHAKDAEVYFILKGEGEMYIGTYDGKEVQWDMPVKVGEGDVFTIHPGMVHQLINTSDQQSLTLIFSSPWSHLRGDRIITEDCVELKL